MMKPEKNYNGLDVLRLICALLVMAIHMPPIPRAWEGAFYCFREVLCRCAVPSFFLISGFFLGKKVNRASFDGGVLKKYVLRILRLYLIWSAIYFPLSFLSIRADPGGIGPGLLKWLRDLVFSGSYVHLWYLNATVTASLMLWALWAGRVKQRRILLLAAGLYLLGMAPGAWGFLENTPLSGLWSLLRRLFQTSRNGIFLGFPYMALGACLAEREDALPRRRCGLGLAVSLAALVAEGFFLRSLGWGNLYNFYLFMVPAVFFLFCLAKSWQLKDHPRYRHMRQISMLLYYLHFGVRVAVDWLFARLSVSQDGPLRFCAVLLITLAAAELLLAAGKRRKWIRALY